ncbi:MAG: hypothetical protein QXQ40_01120 [Candidatus Aenigmatarchaeota archaeon]
MADVYTMLGFGVGVMITILALITVYKLFTGEINFGMFSNVQKTVLERRPNSCGSDNDCIINKERIGVCVLGECTCFVDAHCKNKCDMSIGRCI